MYTDTNIHVPKLVCCGSEQMNLGFSEKRSVTQTDKQTSPEKPHAAWPEVACANTITICHISEWKSSKLMEVRINSIRSLWN